MAAAHAAAAAPGCRCTASSAATSATLLPMPQIQIFGGGAHAGRRVDIQDFMVVCPAAESFAQALEWTAEVYRAAGRLMQRRGQLTASPTKAAGGRISTPTSRRWKRWCRRSRRAGYRARRAGGHRAGRGGLGVRPRGPLQARAGSARARCRRLIELLLRWIERYPIVSIEDPLAEDDLAGFRALHARRGPQAADRRRRPAGVARRPGARGRCRRRRQLRAAQAQPARHAERNTGRLAGGARRAMPASSRRAPARPRTRPSCTWPSAGRSGN